VIVYLNANFLIYFIEMNPVWGPKVTAYVTRLLADGHELAVSDLTRLECQVGPLMSGNTMLLGKFTTFFQSPDVQVLPLTAAVCDRAAALRAKYRFKTPDALHLAAAIERGCDRFLTNDVRLKSCTDITVVVLQP
jgi:predicted nucleic acid-binding protein